MREPETTLGSASTVMWLMAITALGAAAVEPCESFPRPATTVSSKLGCKPFKCGTPKWHLHTGLFCRSYSCIYYLNPPAQVSVAKHRTLYSEKEVSAMAIALRCFTLALIVQTTTAVDQGDRASSVCRRGYMLTGCLRLLGPIPEATVQ